MPILLHDRHPNRLKISRATISQRIDPVTKRSLASVEVSSDHYCNTPDVTFHICNSNSCHFRLCVMIFPPWSGFFFRFAFCSCHAFHIISSCALHLHTCSSHASEHFPRCPFSNPALLSPPVHPSSFLSCACVKLSRNGPRLVKWP